MRGAPSSNPAELVVGLLQPQRQRAHHVRGHAPCPGHNLPRRGRKWARTTPDRFGRYNSQDWPKLWANFEPLIV